MDQNDKKLERVNNFFHVGTLFIKHSTSTLTLKLLHAQFAFKGSATSNAPIHGSSPPSIRCKRREYMRRLQILSRSACRPICLWILLQLSNGDTLGTYAFYLSPDKFLPIDSAEAHHILGQSDLQP